MSMNLIGTGLQFWDGTIQSTGTYTRLHTTTGYATSYPIGHYMLIENATYGSYSVAVPLNGWDSSTYSSPVYVSPVSFSAIVYTGASGTATITQPAGGPGLIFQRSSTNLGSGAAAAAGTWKSRGGNLVGFLVQRVA